MMRRLRLSLVSAGALLLSCADAGPEAPFSQETSPIVRGEPSDEADDAVVSLGVEGGFTCTGTLIAPNVVLTALHCVANYNTSGTFTCRSDGTRQSVSSAGLLGDLVEVGRIQIRVGPTGAGEPSAYAKKIFSTRSTQVCTKDLAVVVLDRDLDAPLASLRFGAVTKRNELVRVVGYGETDQASSQGRHRRDGVRVIDVGRYGDNPGSSTAAPGTLALNEGPCHGDSGGPAFSQETGAIVGVYSILVGSTCTATGVRNVYTQVAEYEGFIRNALESEGLEPLVEGGETPGAGGAGNEPGAGGASEGGSPAAADGGTAAVDPGTGGTSVSSGGSAAESPGEAGTPGEPDPGTGATSSVPGGSGSRRDGSCTCGTVPFGGSAPLSAALSALFVFGAVMRRVRAVRAR